MVSLYILNERAGSTPFVFGNWVGSCVSNQYPINPFALALFFFFFLFSIELKLCMTSHHKETKSQNLT